MKQFITTYIPIMPTTRTLNVNETVYYDYKFHYELTD